MAFHIFISIIKRILITLALVTSLAVSEIVRNAAQAVFYAVSAVVALIGISTYVRNVRLDRSRWLTQVYEKFFERDALKPVRDLLDNELPDGPRVLELVRGENATFTDYLNFFEYVAYLRDQKQLTDEDVAAMFQYYFESLRKHPSVREYIENRRTGYERLNSWLRGSKS